MTYHFAFTDVHGCLELYKQAMNYIETFCKKQNAEYRIFYLGDAADRGKMDGKSLTSFWEIHQLPI